MEVRRRELGGQSTLVWKTVLIEMLELENVLETGRAGPAHNGLTRHKSRGDALTKIFACVDVQWTPSTLL